MRVMKQSTGWMVWLIMAVMAGSAVSAAQEGDERSVPRILDLATAQRIALSDNPTLEAALDRVRQARARVAQARSDYWPRLDATGSGSKVWYGEAPLQVPGAEDDQEVYTAGLSATWTLFDGFERKFRTLAAQYGAQGRRADRLDLARLLLASVADAFHNAQLARENMAIAEADQRFNQRLAEDARARRRVGTGSLSDVLNFEVAINAARAEVIRTREAYLTALYGLAVLMGHRDGRLDPGVELAPLPPETDAMLTLPDPAGAVAHALAHRPDVRRGRMALRSARAGIGQARSGYLPRLNLRAAYEGERIEDPGFESEDMDASVGLTLSYNLFQGGYTRARVLEAKGAAAEARNLLADARNTAVGDVREAMAALTTARDQLILQRENARLVRRNRDLVEKEYAAGQTSLVRLNEAQRDLIQARGRLALARVSLRQAWQGLSAATGKILDPFEIDGKIDGPADLPEGMEGDIVGP